MNFHFAPRLWLATAGLVAMLIPAAAWAQSGVEVTNAWSRASAPAQKNGAVYLDIRSATAARLVAAASPAAAKVEIHNVSIENNVMRMFPVAGIDLPAGQGVKLAPGGYHVMLFDLKHELKKGDTVPVTLTVERGDKSRQTVEVKAEVMDITTSGMSHGAK